MGLILHVVPDLGLSGIARQVSLLAPALAAENWPSQVAVLRGGGAFEPALRAAGVPIHNLGGSRRLDLRPWSALRRLVAELSPSLVHARGRSAGRLAGLWARWKAGPPLLVSDLTTEVLLNRLDRWLLRPAACIVAGGEWERDRLLRAGFGGANVEVIPPCVAPTVTLERAAALRELQLPANARLIACAGAIERGKGFREAAWVFDILKYVYPDLWLLVLGDGSQQTAVELFGRSLGRDDFRVRFAGSRTDVARLLGLAEVVWVLGERGGRNVALEALTAGVPVVVRDRPELREILGSDAGIMVPNADPHETARATRRLLDDGQARRVRGEAGRKRAEGFVLGAVLPRWVQLYERMLK